MPEGRRSSSPALNPALLPFCVAALTALAFLPALRAGFVYDDVVILGAPQCHGLGWANIRWMFTTLHECNYMPLPWLTFGADFALWGAQPAGFHLTNLLFHCANAALFMLVALELLARGRPSWRDRLAAAAAALFFSAHPLRVESVAWIIERKDMTCGFFFLWSVLAWLRARRPGENRPGCWRALALAAFGLSLMCKLAGVMLPVALLLLDARLAPQPAARGRPAPRRIWVELLPFFALSALFGAVALLAQSRCGAMVSLEKISGGGRVLLALTGLLFYIGKTVWPIALSPVYRWSLASLAVPVLAGACALAAGAASAYFSRRLRPVLLTAFGWYALMLVPVLGIVKVGSDVASDRYGYLPCLAWAVLLAAGLRALPRRASTVWAATAALLLLLGAATWRQTEVWHDSATLWRHALTLEPMSSVAHEGLADALLAEGRVGEAILYLEEGVRLHPERQSLRKTLDDVRAREHTTLKDHARFHNELGVERAESGEFEQALWHFRKALPFDPGSRKIKANIDRAQRGDPAGYER